MLPKTLHLLLFTLFFSLVLGSSSYAQCTVSIGADTSFCLGDSIILNPGPGWSAVTWQNLSNSQTQTVSRSGTYWVMVVDSNGCDAEDTIVVDVFNLPKPRFTYVQDSLGNVDFTDITASPAGWFWDFGDGSTSTQQHPSHTYSASGNYTVCLTVVNANACVETRCDTLSVTAPMTSLNPTPDLQSLQVYPNPAQHRLWVSGSKDVPTVQLLSTLGTRVPITLSPTNEKGKWLVSWAPLPAAVYLLQIDSQSFRVLLQE